MPTAAPALTSNAQALTQALGAAVRAQRHDLVALLTPVVKAFLTHLGHHGANEALGVLGGHGYVHDWGIEQHVRDSRIALIYEGTNEIQAIDLLLRKVLPDGGKALSAVLVGLRGALDASRDFDAEVLRRLAELRYLTTTLCAACAVPGADPALAARVADDFLRAVALVLLAWAWSQILATSTAPRWSAPAQALRAWVLPELDMRLAIIRQQMATPPHNNATA